MALTDNLISYYKFDEASGNLIDAHASNDGTNNSVTYGATGKINDAYTYNGTAGSGSWTDTNTTFWSGTNDFTISFWTKSDGSQNTYSCVFDAYAVTGNIGIGVTQDYPTADVQNFMWGNGSNWFGLSFGYNPDTDTAWKHIAVTKSGNEIIIYLNGSEVTRNSSATVNFGTVELWLAKNKSAANREFGGEVDEMGLWNAAKTPTEISDLYNSGDGLAYPVYYADGRGSVKINKGGAGTACLRKDYPYTEGLIAGTTKQTKIPYLEEQGLN